MIRDIGIAVCVLALWFMAGVFLVLGRATAKALSERRHARPVDDEEA